MVKATWTGIAVSDNRRLMHTRGRMIPNPAYIAFKEGMAWDLTGIKGGGGFCSMLGRVSVRLSCSLPVRMDVSAIVKAALDAIQLSGVILDDNQVDFLEVRRVGKAEGKTSTIVFEIDEIA